MKKLILILIIIISLPLSAIAQNYFKDGTKWVTQTNGTHNPTPTFTLETTTIEGDTIVNGHNALKMFTSNDTDKSFKLMAVIRTDGDKVYFRNRQDNDEWYLLYDFGLTVGQGCYVYSMLYPDNATDLPKKTYIKCTELKNDSQYNGWGTMIVEEYETESCDVFLGTGTWIKGLASIKGVIENNMFDMDGRGSQLLEASSNGQVIYRKSTSEIYTVKNENIMVRTEGLNVYISQKDKLNDISLCTCDGRLIGNYKVTNNETHLVLPEKGIYIVKCGKEAKKIRVF